MIPRTFHFIWLGPRELPEKHRDWIESWEFHHPEWNIRIWGNDDVPRLRNQEQFDRARSWAGKADILRVEIVFEHGGVFLDTDFECLRPIDGLIANCDGFLARSHPSCRIANGVFGATPGHEFLNKVIRDIPKYFRPDEPDWTGPTLFTRLGRSFPDIRIFEQKVFFPINADEKLALHALPEWPGSYGLHWFEASWIEEGGQRLSSWQRWRQWLRKSG